MRVIKLTTVNTTSLLVFRDVGGAAWSEHAGVYAGDHQSRRPERRGSGFGWVIYLQPR